MGPKIASFAEEIFASCNWNAYFAENIFANQDYKNIFPKKWTFQKPEDTFLYFKDFWFSKMGQEADQNVSNR